MRYPPPPKLVNTKQNKSKQNNISSVITKMNKSITLKNYWEFTIERVHVILLTFYMQITQC